MTVPPPNSPDVLCAEILAEARRKCGEISRRAKTEADKVLTEANSESEIIRRENREKAQTEAVRRQETILATVAVEAGQLRAAHIEALLESIRLEIQRRLLAQDFNVHETLVTLAAEAIRQMPGNNFVLKISSADHDAFGESLAEEIARRAGRSPLNLAISADATVADGVIVQSTDGRLVWDNRLSARLERLWPELRRQISIQVALVGENTAQGGGT